MERQLAKREIGESSRGCWSAIFCKLLLLRHESSERRRVMEKMSKLAIKPKEMKTRKSGRIKRMPWINYQESLVSSGGTISSGEDQYLEDDPEDAPGHEHVSSIHENPRINLYHLGGVDGEGRSCCPTCRAAIYFNYRKCGDLVDVIEDLERRLSTRIEDTRKVFMKFRDELWAQVDQVRRLSVNQVDHLKTMENQLAKLKRSYQPDNIKEEPEEPYDPEEPYYPYYLGGKDPLDSPVDDEHWYDDED